MNLMTASSIPSKRDRYDGKLSALAYDGSDKSHKCELRTFIPAFNDSLWILQSFIDYFLENVFTRPMSAIATLN